jgi:D-hexose-6-phosphate mutarotase
LLDWKLIDSRESESGVSLHWRLQLCDWQADLYAELGRDMELRLKSCHEDSEPCHFGHALHAYWRISDVEDVALQGLEGAQGYDQLKRRSCRQEGELRVAGGCQRVFETNGPLQLQDQAWQRQLRITSGDSANTIVWHPGNRPLLGVAGNEATGFVCVEAASGSDESLRLAPGERAELSLQACLVH